MQQTCEWYYEDLPDLEFELGDGNTTQKFTLEPWQYTITGNNQGIPACMVAVSYMQSNLVILGDPFLRKYVTSFDYENDKITIGENINAPVSKTPS